MMRRILKGGPVCLVCMLVRRKGMSRGYGPQQQQHGTEGGFLHHCQKTVNYGAQTRTDWIFKVPENSWPSLQQQQQSTVRGL
mmetsp:Transcript_22103/g.47866  ORF Transcript_22103/g.47866 Transcript_22103/m.47866 type:complete len:82 (+) Transcript_22103:539-784(+)